MGSYGHISRAFEIDLACVSMGSMERDRHLSRNTAFLPDSDVVSTGVSCALGAPQIRILWRMCEEPMIGVQADFLSEQRSGNMRRVKSKQEVPHYGVSLTGLCLEGSSCPIAEDCAAESDQQQCRLRKPKRTNGSGPEGR